MARQGGNTLGEWVEEAIRLRLVSRALQGQQIDLPTAGGEGIRPGINPFSNSSLLGAAGDDELDEFYRSNTINKSEHI
jgi:hypothetical protein